MSLNDLKTVELRAATKSGTLVGASIDGTDDRLIEAESIHG